MSNISGPIRFRDLLIAEQVMSQFFSEEKLGLNLFELVVDLKEKSMNFRLSPWVIALAEKYTTLYGEEEGEIITRRVISFFMRDRHTLH